MPRFVEKKGTTKYKRVKCLYCESILKYKDKNVKTMKVDEQYDIISMSYIKCPVCKNKTPTFVLCNNGYVDYTIKE